MWKLSAKKEGYEAQANDGKPLQCPFTGMTAMLPGSSGCPASKIAKKGSSFSENPQKEKSAINDEASQESIGTQESDVNKKSPKRSPSIVTTVTVSSSGTCSVREVSGGSLSAEMTQKIFPYHVVIDSNFTVTHVGSSLPGLLDMEEFEIIGLSLDEVLWIRKPLNASWTWDWMRKLEDQKFEVEPVDDALADICFMASVISTTRQAMIILSPNANNLKELRTMGLTLSDLPSHGAYRDAVFLREHLSTQMNNALKMEKLSKTLEREKALLEELLPEHAAEGLRQGRAVEPMLHQNVTVRC